MTSATLHKFAPAAEMGSADKYPPGSIEWAERISSRLQIAALSVNKHTVLHLGNTIKQIWDAQPPPWEIFPVGKPYGTPDEYCLAITGHSWKFLVETIKEFSGDIDLSTEQMQATLARAQTKHRNKPGRPPKLNGVINTKSQRAKDHGSGHSSYLLRRLARYHPKILAAYERGEFKSARAAAIAAGFVVPPTPLIRLRKAWAKASAAERETFRQEITER